MLAPASSPDAGNRLRADRKRLRLSTREVARLSDQIATEKKDKQYYVSHGWVSDIENGKFKPSPIKLYSLSVIYGGNYEEILALFGIPVRGIGPEHKPLLLPNTHLVEPSEASGQTIEIPVELRDRIQLEQTNLVSRMFERWGEIPLVFLQQIDWRQSLYGYIGIEDDTLYPLIRPGSLVQIDSRQTRIEAGSWQNECDRPIYFVELRDKYMCSWCELDGSQLILIPTPQSRGRARHVRYPEEADVLGRVTAVSMCIAEVRKGSPRGASSL